ncbi:MAG: MFS transporter [Anaerolineales bacterium]|jgi:FHS family Na+ dependent glucose MFS transporter 1
MNLSARQTTAYFSAFFILGTTIASLGPTLPYLASNTGASVANLGLLFTLRSGGYLVGSIIGGRLYDHLPGHRLLGIAILIGGVSLALIPQISSFAVIIAIMLLIGLAEATLDVGSNTQLVWVHGARSGPYLNGMFLFAGIGGTLSPLLLSSIGGTWGYRLLALASLPVTLWAFFTPSPPRQAHEKDRPASTLSPFLFALFCLLTFIFIGGEVGFSGWIYSYAYELGLGTEQTAGLLTSFYWLGISLGRIAAIFTSSRFKPGRIVLANLTGLVISLGLILLNPASQTFLWIGSLGFGFFLAPVFPTTFAYLERKTPITGTAAGVLWASGSFGAMLYPWVMGMQMADLGPVSIMVTLAISFGAALLLFGWVSRQ